MIPPRLFAAVLLGYVIICSQLAPESCILGFTMPNPTPSVSLRKKTNSSILLRRSRLVYNDEWDEERNVAEKDQSSSLGNDVLIHRRKWMNQMAVFSATACCTIMGPLSHGARAEDAVSEPPTRVNTKEMKKFEDPLFEIEIPKEFFAIRRQSKGDLPDEKTGEGRRGSSIFTAGNLGKAQVVAVERFPTRVLLEENGIKPQGDLSSFFQIGKPMAITKLLNARREGAKTGSAAVTLRKKGNTEFLGASFNDDGTELSFQFRTEIDVQKPELLMETYGVSELFRVTVGKASLTSKDGNLMAVFASALENDFQGPDGAALEHVASSFLAKDQS